MCLHGLFMPPFSAPRSHGTRADDQNRARIMPDKTDIHVSIAMIVHDNQILICQRFSDVPLGGMWEFPGGKIEPGETPEAAVVREVREELAVEVIILQPLAPHTHEYDYAVVTLHPFLCRLSEILLVHQLPAQLPQSIGCAQYQWAHLSTLKDHHFPPANNVLIDGLINLLTP
jgi:mutator protein MutT